MVRAAQRGVVTADHRSMSLTAFAAAALMAATPACAPHVQDGHAVVATGAKAFVKEKKGGHRELVVRGVEPTAVRRVLEEKTGCDIDLEAFEAHFRAAPHELHARLGRHAIRVRSFDYEPETKTLRTKGKLQREPKDTSQSSPRQQTNLTAIVYASTFIPFDSSF